jgi:hypothetical protein
MCTGRSRAELGDKAKSGLELATTGSRARNELELERDEQRASRARTTERYARDAKASRTQPTAELRWRATENGSTMANRELAACARGSMVDGDHGRRGAQTGEQQGDGAADGTEQGAAGLNPSGERRAEKHQHAQGDPVGAKLRQGKGHPR